MKNYISSDIKEGSESFSKKVASTLLAAIAVLLIPAISHAGSMGSISLYAFGNGSGSAGGISDSLCTIVDWFQSGGVGAAIASLAVIFLGIAAFFGKVTWGMALMFATGIFAIFGSGEIVSAITNGASMGCFGGGGLSITGSF